MFSLIYAWINCWVNNREAGDLRRYRAHYDVTVMPPVCDRRQTDTWVRVATQDQGLCSQSGNTSYRQISWSLKAARLGIIMIVTLWNLTGISAALLPRGLSNFRAIGKVETQISRPRDFTRSCGKMSYRLMNISPEVTRMKRLKGHDNTLMSNSSLLHPHPVHQDTYIQISNRDKCKISRHTWKLLCILLAHRNPDSHVRSITVKRVVSPKRDSKTRASDPHKGAVMRKAFLWRQELGLKSPSWRLMKHVDVMRWEYFPHYWSFLRESIGDRWIPLTMDRWFEALMFSFMLAYKIC